MRYQNIVATPKRAIRVLAALTLLFTLVAGSLPVHAAGPTISITSPTSNTTQQGTIKLAAAAGPDTLGVTFKVEGPGYPAKTFDEDTAAPYSVSWDSTPAPINKLDHTITAVARGPGGTTNATPVKVKLNNPHHPGKVMVLGDSVTQQAFDPNGDGIDTFTANAPAAADLLLFKKMGWSTKDVQTTVNNYSIFRHPEKLVVAMGLNDAGTFFSDGWNPDDLERFRTLINTPHANSCIALVLPGHADTGNVSWFNSWATEIDEAREDLIELAATRPRTITIDWQPVMDEHPEYVDEDGIHLLTPGTTPMEDLMAASQGRMNPVDPAAAEARQEFYWDGAAKCQAPSATFQTPVNGVTVEGAVPLAVNVTGPSPTVQFQVDGQNISSPVTSAPYQIDWDSTTMPDGSPATNGTHTITAIAANPAGSHTASINVNVQNPPLPGTVELVGDSITFQAFYSRTGVLPTAPDDAHRDVFAGLGWRVQEVQPHVTERAAQRWPETLIVALSTNDSSPHNGGWTSDDVQRFRTLINSVHAETKVVLVLPGYGSGVGAAHAAQIDLAKQDLTALTAERPHTIVISWQEKIDADPSVMDVDGIHLAWETITNPDGTTTRFTHPHAAEVRQQLYWDAWQLALQS